MYFGYSLSANILFLPKIIIYKIYIKIHVFLWDKNIIIKGVLQHTITKVPLELVIICYIYMFML